MADVVITRQIERAMNLDCGKMTRDSWAKRFTRDVIAEVKRRREELGWSAQRLADECTALGFEMSRSTIADIENGRRAHLGVPDLLVLAKALGVPPLLLLFPVGSRDEVEVLPGETRPAFRAALWFSGEAASPARASDDGEVIVDPDRTGPGRPLALYRTHDEEFRKEIGSMDEAVKMGELAVALADPQRESAIAAAAMWREAAEAHRRNGERIRETAEADGMIPPARILGVAPGDTDETDPRRTP